jgi:hypothetical protein
MKSLFDLLQNYKPPERSLNPRASLIKEFIDEINKERIGTKYKPVSAKCIAIKLGVFKCNEQLVDFLAECRDFKRANGSFSKRFFGGYHKQNWK